MKIFNPISITVTLSVHLVVGGVLLFTQGCQSATTLPDPAEPPPVIPVSELNNQSKRTWDDTRLQEPTRPAWAQGGTQSPAVDEWNPPVQDFPDLEDLKWESVPQNEAVGTGTVSTEPRLVPYTVVRGDSLSRIARNHGVSVAELKRINGLSNDLIRVDQELMVPVAGQVTAGTARVETPDTRQPSAVTHQVVAGDSLSRIARQHGVTIAALKSANGLTSDTIRIGQELVIPNGKPGTTPVAPPAVSPREAPISTPITAGESVIHKVAAGEVLSTIARRYGTTVAQIKSDNGITDERRLQINQELVIRAKPKSTETVAPMPTVPSQTTTLRDSIQVRETTPTVPVAPVDEISAPVNDGVDTTLSEDEHDIMEQMMNSEDAGVNAIRN